MDLLLALTLLVAAPAAATIVGTVRDDATDRPLAGVEVRLPELERATLTDTSGAYRLDDVPPGPRHLEVRLLGYASRTLHALVPRSGDLEVNVALRARPVSVHPVEVRAPVVVRGVEPGATRYPDREASSLAIGSHPLLAEPDGFQALGGGDVALHPETAGGVQVRGGASDQTAFTLDGVPVLSPYHAAGVWSAWNADALARIALRASDPSAAGLDALSATVEGMVRDPGREPRVQGGLSTTQGRLTLDGPLGPVGYVISARGGLHDLVAPRGERSYLSGGTGDGLAKLEAPAFGGRIEALYTHNTNRIGSAAVAEERVPTRPRNRFEWDGDSYGLSWRRAHLMGLAWAASGDAAAEWAMPVGRMALDADRDDAGIKLAVTSEGALGNSGLELDARRTRAAYDVTSDSAGTRFGLQSDQTRITLTPRLGVHVGAGVEVDTATPVSLEDGVVRAAPRVRLSGDLPRDLAFTASFVRTHQSAQSLRNPESVIGHVFPADVTVGSAGTPIPIAESDQGIVGLDWRPAAGVRLGLELYERRSRRLALIAPRSGEPFGTGALAVGAGRARGLAVELAAGSARWGVLASYGWQRVRLAYGDSSYVPEHAATHRLEGGAVVHPFATTALRIGGVAEMGRRVTAIPGAFEWESCNLRDQGCELGGSPHYGDEPLGGTPLPAYARFDLGLRQHAHLTIGGRDAVVGLFGTYSNLFGRKNLLTYALDPATGRRVGIELRPAAVLVVGMDWRY